MSGYQRPFIRNYASDVEDLKKEADRLETDKSASTTGVLDYEKQSEVVLYFDHIYPMPISGLSLKRKFLSPIQNRVTTDDLKQKVLDLSSTDSNPLPENTKISEFVPLKRDAGAFVKFEVPPETTCKELINQIVSNLEENEVQHNKNIFNYVKNLFWNKFPKCYQVKGTPWIEDLRRYPSPKLKVIFEGDPLTEEELYLLFRRYGLIVDIIPVSSSNPTATIIFKYLRSAVCAKNCITGISLNSSMTTLHLQYIPIERVNYLMDFIVNHQKITIPAIVALLATLAVLIFDPIRQLFIEQHITHKYSLETYKDNRYVKVVYYPYRSLVQWLNNSYDYIDEKLNQVYEGKGDLEVTSEDSENINILWNERFEKIKQLKLWIYENINTFIVVKGPKGSGKEEFVLDHTLNNDEKLKRKVLYIDCDALVKARSDNGLIKTTARQLGYFPVFTWTNSISQFVDLGVQGLTGQKSGLSESKETQLKNMFSLTTQALRNIALSDYEDYRNDTIKQQKRRTRKTENNTDEKPSISVEEEIIKEEDYLQQHPEAKPIIVVNNFQRKSDGNNDMIYKLIAEWTSSLVQSNMSHVIFITHDVGSVQHLTDSLPNQVFKTISLSDASQRSAKQYVWNQLNDPSLMNPDSLDKYIEPLGGRMLDLQAFIRRIKSGESANDALSEMVNQASEQITTFFLNNTVANESDSNWNTAQVWAIMKFLSENDSFEYNELSKISLFKSSNETLATLAALEKHDLISFTREKGVLSRISTGRPLYKAAFKELINDRKVYKLYETDYYNNLITIESTKIFKLEDEINKISRLSDIKYLKNRLEYVSSKINTATETIMKYEEKIKEIGKLNEKSSSSFLGIKFN
ncbi:DEHA2F20108p [Debaryomyces hansenii CBS767]|uniref:Mitochondrial escape protein 2 n=1 Tax=Debaryomyces hansenii (strain ATCC 36239 / CBS 767 / BCRC 21394 / JCM 1990 / NBRC 0083 / IGC 2968) TaxID=284592 RepID=YME2_DEBHA|nr:DEHA2F20108p [Debaryomyces hansenii CBS767]Q6BKQ1.2 RecName: Full=Mitochondrial escape protein 2; Flags: Precursor [Debaryomyces hansenii CBS767]CAG89608.2 DEHA2F20108p [Debaryomyces hansenii CBS767]|eukprot:XP_461220.2 DEHA2F20108p [Debaryomyces hansenii CBS767]